MEILTPSLYRPIFYGLLSLVALVLFPKYYIHEDNEVYKETKTEKIIALLIALFLIYLIGNRPPIWQYFGDSEGLAIQYNLLKFYWQKFTWDNDAQNLLFDNLYVFMATSGYTYTEFFTVCAAIYLFSTLLACYKLFPNNVLLSFLVCLSGFLTFSHLVNGFKAGMASAIFLLALAYRERSIIIGVLIAFVSWGFHHSFHVCLAAFLGAYILRSTKLNVLIWIVCVIIAANHITFFQEFFSDYTDEKGSAYLSVERMNEYPESGYYTGFRLDFIIYSMMPIALGYYTSVKKNIESAGYKYLLNVYILSNSVWLLCMYASYANRIAALSWLMYPVLLLYPFLRCNWGENKYQTMIFISTIHFAFTLFMLFIYSSATYV